MRMRWAIVVLGLLTVALSAWAAGPEPANGLILARLKYGGGGDWYQGPSTMPNLAQALKERTSVFVESTKEAAVSADDPELFKYPFIFMDGHGNVRLTDAEVAGLRQYLSSGGFLFANDDYGMDQSFRREIARVFPDRKLVELPFSHPIYHCFYDFPHGLPKIHEHDGKPPQGFGIFDQGRLCVYYDYEADIGDGLEDPEAHGDPPAKREEAIRMAINLVIYAMTY